MPEIKFKNIPIPSSVQANLLRFNGHSNKRHIDTAKSVKKKQLSVNKNCLNLIRNSS